MKKALTVFLILVSSLGLASCKKDASPEEDLTPKFSINVDEINVKIGDTIKIDFTLTKGLIVYWIESESYLIEVSDDNEITGLEEGSLVLRGEVVGHSDLYDEVKVNVLKKKIDDYEKTSKGLVNYLMDNMYGLIIPQNIIYYGSEDYSHLIGKSLGSYLFNYEVEVKKNMIDYTTHLTPDKELDSLEWIAIHDTGNSNPGSTALANSNYVNNPANPGSSWHYTIGNDGIYQQIEDNKIGFHAGDGTKTKFKFIKTNIKATKEKPIVTISKDGYYEIEGQKTDVLAPKVPGKEFAINSDINRNGIRVVTDKDGYYNLPLTYYNADYRNIAMYGGNLNSIGIEMAVNKGSNVWLTWQMTAKYVAQLLVKHNLGLDRVVTHNNFSGKTCPQTMMLSGNLDAFYDMIEVEYSILKHFKDYKIELITDSEFVNENGIIVKVPTSHSEIKYTIKVTSPTGEVASIDNVLEVRILAN